MSIPLTINGAVFEYPVDFDENWGIDATGWAQAVTNGMLQMAGGNFPLTADVNFGPNFGLLAKYFETRSSNPATTGTVRLSSADAGVVFRNNANNGNLALTTNASDQLTFNGSAIAFTGAVNSGTQYQLGYYATSSNVISGNPNTMAATQVLVSDSHGVPTTSGNGGTTATEIGFVHGVTSTIQTQINATVTVANTALPRTGGTMSGAIAMGANKITGMADGTAPQDAVTVNQLSGTLPSGVMVDFGGTVAPTGWLLCDGSVVAQATYPGLFTAIGSNWNTGGEGGGNFRLPNMTRRISMGSGGSGTGTIGNAVGNTGGEETHTLISSEVPNTSVTVLITDLGHGHSLNSSPSTGTLAHLGDANNRSIAAFQNSVGGATFQNTNSVGEVYVQTNTTGITASGTVNGSNGAHNNIQPAAIVLKIIKI